MTWRSPVGVWWLDDAELVPVWVGENVPAPPELLERLPGQLDGAEAEDASDLGLQVWRAQVQVHPVLVPLFIRHLLQQDLRTLAVCGKQTEVLAQGQLFPDIAEHPGPEFPGAVQAGARDHHNTLPAQAG